MLSGRVCPSDPEIVLEFLLSSNVLGEAVETISVPVNPDESVQSSAFAGVSLDDKDASSIGSDASDEIEKLTI